jgi:hypothetical protein
MVRKSRWTVVGLLLAAPVLMAQTVAAPATAPPVASSNNSETVTVPTPNHHSHKTQKAPPPMVLPPLPSGPLRQMPMDMIPATPAKVSYQGGMLTISAQNSTLGEILRDVRKLTGASIEIPASGGNEHVVTHLGPGTPRDVLVSLLNGSSFNYVMIGSSSDPAAVASVILTPKEPVAGQGPTAIANANVNPDNGGASGMPPNRFPGRAGFNPQNVTPMPGNGVAALGEGDEATADDQEAADEPAEEQTQPGQPEAPATNAAEQQQQPADPNQPNAGPKTPEQILEMLRRPQQPGGAGNPPTGQPPQQ